jgi:hypothetical protein
MKILDVPQTGSVGETVTYQSRFGLIRRRKIIPRDPRTALQLDRRTAFQRARQFWGTPTDEQFLAWNTLARTRQTRSVCDITYLFLAKFSLLPVGKRIFIRTVQQINGWRDLPKTISARIPTR